MMVPDYIRFLEMLEVEFLLNLQQFFRFGAACRPRLIYRSGDFLRFVTFST